MTDGVGIAARRSRRAATRRPATQQVGVPPAMAVVANDVGERFGERSADFAVTWSVWTAD
jgi:hypothetical protein